MADEEAVNNANIRKDRQYSFGHEAPVRFDLSEQRVQLENHVPWDKANWIVITRLNAPNALIGFSKFKASGPHSIKSPIKLAEGDDLLISVEWKSQGVESRRVKVESHLINVPAISLAEVRQPRASFASSFLLNPPPAELRALAGAITPRGRRRLLSSRAFHVLWSDPSRPAAARFRQEIVRVMIERGEILGPLPVRIRSGHLLEVDPLADAVIARRILLDGTYEQGLIEAALRFLRKGDTAFDVGACYGHVSLALAAHVGREGHVIAVEPNPHMASSIRQAVRKNGSLPVNVVQAALSDRPGKSQFKVVEQENIGGSRLAIDGISASDAEMAQLMKHLTVISLLPGDIGNAVASNGGISKFETVMVDLDTLDDLALRHGVPRLVKVDIEGAELLCLRGGQRLLSGDLGPQPIVTIEYSNLFPTFGGRRDEAFLLLTGFGYTAWRLLGGKSGGGRLVPIDNPESAPAHDDLFFLPRGERLPS